MNKRHFGIDCMRALCMLLVVVYHLQGHGGLIASERLSPAGRAGVVMLQSICQMAIDGFALITGYIGYARGQRLSSLVALWLRALFYSVGLTAAVWLIWPGAVRYDDIRCAFLPVITGQYWYFTAYVGCFVLSPLARAAIEHLPRREAASCLLGTVVVYCVLPYLLRNDPFLTSSGNHALWLLILYALGAYIRRYDPFAGRSTRSLLALLAGACAVQALSGSATQALSRLLTGKAVTQWYWVCNDSPTTLAIAVLALALFARLQAPRQAWPACARKLFAWAVSGSFSVYLIHDHPLVRRQIIMPLGKHLAALPSALVIPAVWATAAGIYLLCIGVDALRAGLFRTLRVSERLLALEQRLSRPR